jgi:hypothetical protein
VTSDSGFGTPPPYGRGTLSDLLPAATRALGVALPQDVYPHGLTLPEAPRCCVLLVDGLGDTLLRERAGHAPYLRSRLDEVGTLNAGFPTTTATSMGSLGTGRPPGGHGLVGYEVLVPELDELLNELSWETPVDPRRWQPGATLFELAAAAGVEVVRVGPAYFDGSGLTEAALRGGRFIAARHLDDRVDAALDALRSAPRSLVYVYWGDVDKVGHIKGAGSWEWGEELAKVDAAVRRLVDGLPHDATLHVTADHGMLDVPFSQRIDVAAEPDLALGVRHLGGEARCPQVYCEPGQAEAVLQRWKERLYGLAEVVSGDDAVAAGWFGPVSEWVRPRIGDVLAPCLPGTAVVDTATQRPELLRQVGLHGSLTPEESLVPLFSVRGSQRG